mmetsp:Transcript_24828/g.36737  ORF Transcript_24828/g.36737 Transcript_24828/m.36737 type:complete len:167 (-) Transcript_24828:164-664(-)|eukprot:CAMPEP_0194200582 /NCGR_PEP_ID=MMETSP0156-20130528/1125_1 /TAXON_ID=33649 /ORGANISM="Thalassionema nitzschioides, Strain L26-B" /LENGTH=166 /DNA_ID=CAMNT_0038925595 /DNA_START=33 /DNA_END=533 /DNA_ORIENTATION=+
MRLLTPHMYRKATHIESQSGPATQALLQINNFIPPKGFSKRPRMNDVSARPQRRVKRRRTSLTMSELISSIEAIDQCIAFPSISLDFAGALEHESDSSHSDSISYVTHPDQDEENEACTFRSKLIPSLGDPINENRLIRSKTHRISLTTLGYKETEPKDSSSTCAL